MDEALINPNDAHVLTIGFLIGESVAGLQDSATLHPEAEIGIDDPGLIRQHHSIPSLCECSIENCRLVVEVGVHQDRVIVEPILCEPERCDAVSDFKIRIVEKAHAIPQFSPDEVTSVTRDYADISDVPIFEHRDRAADEADAIGFDQALRSVSVDVFES